MASDAMVSSALKQAISQMLDAQPTDPTRYVAMLMLGESRRSLPPRDSSFDQARAVQEIEAAVAASMDGIDADDLSSNPVVTIGKRLLAGLPPAQVPVPEKSAAPNAKSSQPKTKRANPMAKGSTGRRPLASTIPTSSKAPGTGRSRGAGRNVAGAASARVPSVKPATRVDEYQEPAQPELDAEPEPVEPPEEPGSYAPHAPAPPPTGYAAAPAPPASTAWAEEQVSSSHRG